MVDGPRTYRFSLADRTFFGRDVVVTFEAPGPPPNGTKVRDLLLRTVKDLKEIYDA